MNFNPWRFPGRLRMAIVLFAIVAGFYWKIALTSQFDWVWGPDLATQVIPWFTVQARSWHAGTFPLWDPYLWAGQPLLGQAQPGAAYPLNWILFSLPLDHGQISALALQWYFVSIRFLAVSFCYLLCRDLGRSRTASAMAGFVFGLGGVVGTTGWPQMVNGAIWAPLVFLFLLRAARGNNRWGNAALSGMFLGVAWLSGHHQLPFFVTLAAAGAWLYFIFRSGRLDRRVAVAAMAAFLFTGLTGALQILPASEYGHLALRWAGTPEPLAWNQPVPYYVHEQYSFKPENLLGLVFPLIKAHFDPFVGIVALALAWIGVAAWWRDHRVRLMAAVSLGGLIYALGQNSVFQGFLYAVIPTLDKARSPSAAILIFEFGVAVLAAFGMDQLSSGQPSPWPRRVMWTVLSFGVFTLAVFQAVYFANKMTFPGDDRVVITAVLALLLGALLFARMRGAVTAKQAGVLMAGLMLLELGNNYVPVFTPKTDTGRERWGEQMKANSDVADFLRKQPGFQRANVPDSAFNANWGAVHEVPMWGGLLASVSSNLLSFEFHTVEARLLYGVAYTIGTQPTPGAGDEVFSGQSGMKVFRNGATFPRAWAVHKLVQARDADEANGVMMRHLPEMHGQAVMLGQTPALDPCAGRDWIDLLEYGADRLLIRAIMACPGMVILSDTYFPGWRARVDGKAARIYEVNGAMRGVMVPAGLHTVTMRYRPASVIWGGLLTLVGILGAVGLVAAGRIPSPPGRIDAARLAIRQWLDAGRTGQVLFLAGALGIAVYFLRLTSPSLHVYFTPDDLMNLHRSWILPASQLVKANLLFFLTSDFIRPMGSVWYRAVYYFAGFNAFWFHAANLAILLVNIFLTYAVARRLSGSRETGAVAALLGSYTTRLGFIYFDTGYIYDVLCYLFFFAAFLFYLRVRQQERLPNAWEMAVFCGLYVCALNSKEMAVTLPVFLAIYELLYDPPRTWAPAGLYRWALREGRTTLIGAAMTLAFVVGRSLGSQALIGNAAYRPLITWARFMATSRHFPGDMTNTGDWPAWGVLALWALLFAVAWSARSRTLKFAWLFLMLSPLPVAFISGRGAAQSYVCWFGWVLYAATLLVGVLKFVTGRIWTEGPRLSQVRGTLLFAVLMLISYPFYEGKGWENVSSSWKEAPENRETVAQLHKAAPQIPSRSKLLFLNDPIRADWENMIFLVRLSYGDRSLQVNRVKQTKQMPDEKAMASYDYVFDYDGGRFIALKRP